MEAARITRTIELDATTDVVWRALTEPALLGDWLGSVVELDVRPGGEGVVVESDGQVLRARVDAVDPGRRLALRWRPDDGEGPESTVELEVEESDGGTRLVVTETVVAEASVARAESRWAIGFLLLGCSLLLRATVRGG